MKIVMIIVFRYLGADKLPIVVAQAVDLSSFSFFSRTTVGEHLHFGTRTVCQRTPAGTRQTVELKKDLGFVCHCYVRQDSLAACLVSDTEYPQRVAFSLINKVLGAFEKQSADKWKTADVDQPVEPEFLQAEMKDYQNPAQGDKISKIQKDLDDIKDIMHKNIDEILQRGEKLDDLMEKSQDLSASSKIFYQKAKDQNSCCSIL